MESCPTVIMTDPVVGLIPADQDFILLEFVALAITPGTFEQLSLVRSQVIGHRG
jgi:hypothetical protein